MGVASYSPPSPEEREEIDGKKMIINMPPDLQRDMAIVHTRSGRYKSDIVREALRQYFNSYFAEEVEKVKAKKELGI